MPSHDKTQIVRRGPRAVRPTFRLLASVSRCALVGTLCASVLPALAHAQDDAEGPVPASGEDRPDQDTSDSAPNDPRAALDEARLYYESGRYEECVVAATEFLEHSPSSLGRGRMQLRSQARTYLAACQLAQGQVAAAEHQFREAILESPQMSAPDPVAFPQAVIDTFVAVRGRLMAALRRQQEEELAQSRREAQQTQLQVELERRRQKELWRLAGQESLVQQNERWMASLPFGVGQFNNGDRTLGWVFFGGEIALAATALTATSIELGLHSQAEGGRSNLDAGQLTRAVGQARLVGNIAWLGTLLAMVAGAVEANLSYQPERRLGTRGRKLPKWLTEPEAPVQGKHGSWAPQLGWLPEGGLSVSGRF